MATAKKKKKKTSGSAKPHVSAVAAVEPADDVSAQTIAEFEEEYVYVRKDLRQLAVVSSVLFAVMLAIGFIM